MNREIGESAALGSSSSTSESPADETGNASTVGIVERMVVEAQELAIEGKQLVDRAYGDSNVRDARSTTSAGWHENRAP